MSVELYRKFTEQLPSTGAIGEIVPYDWWEFGVSLDGSRFAYDQMLKDFGRELANSINAFTLGVRRLKAWDQVLSTLKGENERLSLILEFVDGPVTLALITPYMLKSRFLYASAHLCHQLNLRREAGWSEAKLPVDEEIYLDVADTQGKPWKKYSKFKLSLEKIGNQEFKQATADFRNAFSHRFSPRVALGITNFVSRRIDSKNGRVVYGFGGTLPLDLTQMIELLVGELGKCYASYTRFQALIGEHKAYILKTDATSTATT